MSIALNWENTFAKYDWMMNVTSDRYKWVEPDPEPPAPFERAVCSDGFAAFAAQIAGVYHNRRVLLPGVPCPALLNKLRAFNSLEYWIVEDDPATFNRIYESDELEVGRPVKHPRFLYNIDTMWNQTFASWAAEYDPEQSPVDAVIINGPMYSAAADIIDAWDYLSMNGSMLAFLPFNDLFRNDEEGETLREWAGEHELYYGIPAKGHLAASKTRMIVMFGEKKDP